MHHPLEPLSAAEIAVAVAAVKGDARHTSATRFISISLREPARSLDDTPRARRAECVLFDNARNCAAEVLVSLAESRIEAWKVVEGVQPTMSVDEQAECERAVIASPEFHEVLKRHYGDVDPALVMVDIWSAGNYGSDEDRTRRLARPLCFLRTDPTDNGYARPLEGIRPVVDLNTMTVIRVEEFGHWPLPPESGNYAADRVPDQRTDIAPLNITQPDGPGFRVDGRVVTWQNWSVVVGFNAREGLTLHRISYAGRSILYRASLTEMVVPYGDPGPTQARKNAFDVGEYGMGMCANSLQLGCDCLGHIHYFDADLCDSRGGPVRIVNAICMHEEDYGILWKHTDRRLPHAPEVRRSRRLVISSVSTVENYEYGFFWYFYQDGNVQFEIKLTGILSLAAVHPGEKPAFGTMIAPQLYAPNHQHFFNMKLDFAVDGLRNTVERVDVVADPAGDFHNAFRSRATTIRSEAESMANHSPDTARSWKVVNPSVRNAMGEPVAYRFLPGDNCVPFASPEAWWRRRAGFVDHHVWVTRAHEDERYAAGDYPNQSAPGEGLPRYIADDGGVEDEELSFWYTFGHTHLPRPEDYPVMPSAYIGFLLKPSGFFARNPANDVPPSPKAKKPCCLGE